MFGKKNKSLGMSLPKEQTLHGVKIKKLPVAKYLSALDTLERLPEIIVNTVIPEAGGVDAIVSRLLDGDKDFTELLLYRLLTDVPREICAMLSELLDIPESRLLSVECGEPLTLKELLDIILAFWEMNDLTDFFVNVRRLRTKLTARKETMTGTGSSVGSQQDKAQEFPNQSF